MRRYLKSLIFYFFIINSIYLYCQKDFNFRIMIEPPEITDTAQKEKLNKFNVILHGSKINFTIEKEVWSEWFKVTAEDIKKITGGRFPPILTLTISPSIADIEAFLEFEVDGKSFSSEVSSYDNQFTISITQWKDEDDILRVGTLAQYNYEKYWKEFDRNLEIVGRVERPKKLLLVDRFIGNDSATWKEGIENLAKLGINCILLPPNKSLRDIHLKTGINKVNIAVYCPPGYAFDFNEKETSDEAVKKWAENIANQFLNAGYNIKDIALFNLSDEPGWYFPSVLKSVIENYKILSRFHEYLSSKGFEPEDFNLNDWQDVKPVGRSVINKGLGLKKLYYWSCRFISDLSIDYFARVTKILEEVFYPGIPITVNWNFFSGRYYFPGPFAHNPDKNSPDAAMGSHDWFDFARKRGSTCLWTEDWFGDFEAYQWSFYCSKFKSALRKRNLIFGGYVIGRAAGNGITQKIMAIFGHGGKIVKTYNFGPEYNFPGNCWSENPVISRGIMRAAKILSKAEDLMYDGKPPIPQVAILIPQSSIVWDQKEMEIATGIVDATNTFLNGATTTYMAEVYDLFLALMHLNIPVDFIDELDLSDINILSNYKVIYITAPNIPKECIKPIQDWVEAGGTVVTTYGAITADRYDEPLNTFYNWAGIKLDEKAHPRIVISSAKWKESVVDSVKKDEYSFNIPWAKGKILSFRENTEVIASFSDGSPAIISTPIGKGRVIHYAFYPGCSYFLSQVENDKRGFNGLPCGFSSKIREIISLPTKIANIERFVLISEPMIETPILVSDKGIAITLLNWSGEYKDKIKVEVKLSEKIKEVESCVTGKIQFSQDKDYLVCELPLFDVDVLLIKK